MTEEIKLPQTENNIEKQKKGEKKFNTISGVRFEEGISQENIDEFFRIYSEKIPEHYKNDDLTPFEHRAIGGTTVDTLEPLKPYSLQLKNKTADELSQERNRTVKILAQYVIDLKSQKAILKGEKAGTIDLETDDNVKEKFFELLKKNELKDDQDEAKIYCKFEELKIDPQTGNLIFPYLNEVQDVTLPQDLQGKIKLKEWVVRESEDQIIFIDQNGWRIEKNKTY